jgi:hypothetical protein
MAKAFLAKRESAKTAAARTAIDEFLLEELRRLAALPAMSAPGGSPMSPSSQFVMEWQAFARGVEWQAFARRAKDKDTLRAWTQWRSFGAEFDRAAQLRPTVGTGEEAASVVTDVGVARLESVLSRALATELRTHVLAVRDANLAHAAAARAHESAGAASGAQVVAEPPGVLSAMDAGSDAVTRWDVRLAWDAPVRKAVAEMLREGGALGDALQTLSGGDAAELVECAAIITAEGAAPQIVHSDTTPTLAEAGPQLHTAFVALQDIAPHNGPTRFLPRTHAGFVGTSAHLAFGRDEPCFYEGAASVSALLGAGDCTLYDSRLLHCGGPHLPPPPKSASSERVLFYVSFKHVTVVEGSMRQDSSILPAVAAMGLRLGDLR